MEKNSKTIEINKTSKTNPNNKLISSSIYLIKIQKRAKLKLNKIYNKTPIYYGTKMINDILYNEKTHYVEMFKEYLIYEDYSEFLKQYYGKTLQINRLNKLLTFYEKYSKIFPNYTALSESRYFYKNIKRKQKMINQINEVKKNKINNSDEESFSYSDSNNNIFNSKVINDIYTGHNTILVNESNSTLNGSKSINNFIQKNSFNKKKNDKNMVGGGKKNKKAEKIDKKLEPNQSKKCNDLMVNSFMNSPNNSILKSRKNKEKKFVIDYNMNNLKNTKIIVKPYSYIPKQRSFSNISSPYNKISVSIKYNNIIRKNNYFNNMGESNSLLTKKFNGDMNRFIFNNNNNNNSQKCDKIKHYIEYDKYKRILSPINISNTKNILTDRAFSSPCRTKNNSFNSIGHKSYISHAKNDNRKINIKNYFNKRNTSSKIYSKLHNITKNIKTPKNNNNKFFEKKTLKNHIRKNYDKNLLNNFSPNRMNKYYYKNYLSNLNIKNKNNKNNYTFIDKNKVVNNYNIMNGIMNNSTQINIYTGNDLIKTLNLYWNSIINLSKSPSSLSDYNLSKKKNSTKNHKNEKKKDKNKKSNIEINYSNDKLLKLLKIYHLNLKNNKSLNLKKGKNNKQFNKSHNYRKNKVHVKQIGEFYKKYTNLKLKLRKKFNSGNNSKRKNNIYKNIYLK